MAESGSLASVEVRKIETKERSHVAIARALSNRPKVMLMDEPLGALNALTREEIQEHLLLLTLHEKTTLLFMTHDGEEAIYLSTRILVFSARPGRIIANIPVPFGDERGLPVKLSSEFMQLKRKLLDLLHAEEHSDFDRDALLKKLVQQPLS